MAKIDFHDWTHLSDEMITYCLMDVRITTRLFQRLTERMRSIGFTERGCEVEHKYWWIIQKQRKNGFAFDYQRAHVLFSKLRNRENELRDELYQHFPPILAPVANYKKAYKGDGTFTAAYQRHLEQYPKLVLSDDGGYTAFDYVEFNLGSPKQRVEKLLEIGWVPTRFTKKTDKGGGGNPKVDEESLMDFAATGNPQAEALAKWVVINSRANMIGTWLDAYNEKTGCLHGDLFLANTLRYRHSHPNTANIPAVRVKKDDNNLERALLGEDGFFTYESRDLWTTRAPDSRSLVGVDAKGIQLRIVAHYINNKNFTEAILSEDPHEANRQAFGLPTRALTKTITYAILMGAGDARIASEAKVSLRDAKDAKELFFGKVTGLKEFIQQKKQELKRTGRIKLCDGTPVLVPSDHMIIPYLLQGDESRIMRQAGIYADQEIRRRKLDVLKVGDIHDEWQSDVRIEHVESFIDVCRQAFPKAGLSYQYNVPIECDAKVGKTWASTH